MNIIIDKFGGLNAQADSAKLGEGEYPLLVNGRVRRGTVSPVPANVELDLPGEKAQGIYTIGEFLVIAVDGKLFSKDVTQTGSNFVELPAWSPLSANVERIWAALVPVGSSFTTFKGSFASEAKSDSVEIAMQTPKALLVADGINKCKVVALDGSSRDAKTYDEWTIAEPEYVPTLIQPVMSGNKLYALSPDSGLIYQSVTGRPLDFVVNRTSTGDKGGDASTTAKAVDFNNITALLGSANGALIASTLAQTYILAPDTTRMLWDEPILSNALEFPCGMTNPMSWADIGGDLALITQSGIHSFNALLSQKQEHRLNPLSEKVASILYGTQDHTAATNFDEYALFSVSTIYGDMVLVYDTLRQSWVGMDNFGSAVKQFAVSRVAGRQRLFFITWDNRLFEAYASATSAVRRFYVGSLIMEGQHNLRSCYVQLSNVRGGGTFRATYYADSEEQEKLQLTVTAQRGQTIEPPMPFVAEAATEQMPLVFGISKPKTAYKSGLLLEDNVNGEISMIVLDASEEPVVPSKDTPRVTNPQGELIYGIWAGSFIEHGVAPGSELIVGDYYFIEGSLTDDGVYYRNEAFRARHKHLTWSGSLHHYGPAFAALDAMKRACTYVFSLGNIWSSKTVLSRGTPWVTPRSAMSYIENSNVEDFIEVTKRHRYYAADGVRVVNTGLNMLGNFVEPEGIAAGSIQYNLFKNSGGWLSLLGTPYIDSEGAYKQTDLVWPWASWGTKLMVSPNVTPQARRQLDGFTYLELPPITTGTWLKLRHDGFNIQGELITTTGSRDPFAIHL